MNPRARRCRHLLLPIVLSLLPRLGAAEGRGGSCLGELESRIGPGSRVAVSDTAGRTVQGTLTRLDPGHSLLTLRTYDRSTSRFSDLEMAEETIRSISFHTERRSLKGPLLIGAAMGTAGFLIAASIHGTSDPEDKTRTQSLIVFPTVTAATGFLMGMALSPKKVDQGTVECRAAPQGP